MDSILSQIIETTIHKTTHEKLLDTRNHLVGSFTLNFLGDEFWKSKGCSRWTLYRTPLECLSWDATTVATNTCVLKKTSVKIPYGSWNVWDNQVQVAHPLPYAIWCFFFDKTSWRKLLLRVLDFYRFRTGEFNGCSALQLTSYIAFTCLCNTGSNIESKVPV